MNLDTELTLTEFLQAKPWMMPDIVRGEAFVYSTTLSEAAKIRLLQAARAAADEATVKREHKRGAKPDVYSTFRNLAGDDADLIAKDAADILIEAATGIALSGQDLACSGTIVRAVDMLRDAGESDDAIISFLQSIASGDKRFLSAMHYTPPSPEDADPLRRFERQDIYSNAFKAIGVRKESIRDTLCYLTLVSDYNDIELECRAVLPCVLASPEVRESDALIIIEPTVFAFRRFLATNIRTRYRTIFFFQNRGTAQVLSSLFRRQNLDILCSGDIGKALIDQPLSKAVMLLFGNNIASIDEKTGLIYAVKNAVNDRLSLFIFNSDYDLISGNSSLFQSLSEFRLTTVRTFPAGLTVSTKPERKLLAQYVFGYDYPETDETVNVIQYTQSVLDRNKYRLSIKPFVAELLLEEYRSGSCSFRRKFREEEMAEYSKETGIRTRHEIQYLDNIIIHYTLSPASDDNENLRIKAYVTAPETNGEYIHETERSLSRIAPGRVNAWLAEYPFVKSRKKPHRSVRQELAERQDLFLNRNSLLNAFVYLNPSMEDCLPGYASSILAYIISSPLGEYPVRMISKEILRSFLAEFQRNVDAYTTRQVINVLRVIFDRAKEKGFCDQNPAREMKDYDHETDENLSAVKNNLSQKFLTDEQFHCAIELSLERLHKGQSVYLAVLIKLMTGLQSNCISALTWSDVVTNDEFPELTQIIVRRQCETTTGTVRRFSERANYRKIPCAAMLAQALTAEKNRQMMADGLAEEELLARPIISGKTEIDGRKIVLPSDLNKLCRKLLAELKFELEPYVFPVDKNTTVEIERDFYGRDPLRETWRHHAVKHGGFEVGEINYLLGLQQQDTFSRHYCDFGNDLYQFRLMKKQNDLWEAITHAEGNV